LSAQRVTVSSPPSFQVARAEAASQDEAKREEIIRGFEDSMGSVQSKIDATAEETKKVSWMKGGLD
jgi:hypothetical protein